jgi:hypothetical protein
MNFSASAGVGLGGVWAWTISDMNMHGRISSLIDFSPAKKCDELTGKRRGHHFENVAASQLRRLCSRRLAKKKEDCFLRYTDAQTS